MKKIQHILSNVAVILGLAVLAASCKQFLDPPAYDAEAHGGRVILKVSTGDADSARTVLPSAPLSFSRYELSFTKGGDTVPVSDTSGLSGTGVSQELAEGSWTAAVNAYRRFTPTGGTDTEYLAAQGSANVTVTAGQSSPVTVFIRRFP